MPQQRTATVSESSLSLHHVGFVELWMETAVELIGSNTEQTDPGGHSIRRAKRL
jgi:hypothetical protein